jgi:hypothetical protein
VETVGGEIKEGGKNQRTPIINACHADVSQESKLLAAEKAQRMGIPVLQ